MNEVLSIGSTFVREGHSWTLRRTRLGRVVSRSSTVLVADALERFSADELSMMPHFVMDSTEIEVYLSTLHPEVADAGFTPTPTGLVIVSNGSWPSDVDKIERVEGSLFIESGVGVACAAEEHERLLAMQADFTRIEQITSEVVDSAQLVVGGCLFFAAVSDAHTCFASSSDAGYEAVVVDFDAFRTT